MASLSNPLNAVVNNVRTKPPRLFSVTESSPNVDVAADVASSISREGAIVLLCEFEWGRGVVGCVGVYYVAMRSGYVGSLVSGSVPSRLPRRGGYYFSPPFEQYIPYVPLSLRLMMLDTRSYKKCGLRAQDMKMVLLLLFGRCMTQQIVVL